jgi:hypothetical protein
MNGVHSAVIVTGILCVLGAAVAAVGIRRTAEQPADH